MFHQDIFNSVKTHNMNNVYLKLLFLSLFLMSFSQFCFSQQDKYIVELQDYNTEFSEFSLAFLNQEIIYVSNQKSSNRKAKFYNLVSPSSQPKITSLLEKLNTKYHEGPISVSSDGNMVFFTRNSFFQKEKRYTDDKLMPLQIFYVIYENGKWSNEFDFPYNSTQYSCGHPSLSQDGKYLYFASDMPSGYGESDIYRSEFINGKWGKPENLGEKVNSSSNELFPYISAENILYFSSNCHGGLGELDIWYIDMNNTKAISKINMDSPINTPFDDFAMFTLEKSNHTSGYISSNRPNGKGSDDIYFWKYRIKPLNIEGFVTNSTGKTIPDAQLTLVLPDSTKSFTKSDSNGYYSLAVSRKVNYTFKASHEQYYSSENVFSTEVSDDQILINHNIRLQELAVLKFRTVDLMNMPLEDVSVKIILNNEIVYRGQTSKEWILWRFPKEFQRNDSVNLLLEFEKVAYHSRKISFNKVQDIQQEVLISPEEMVEKVLEESIEISDILKLNPIYYDYDKWEIRADAAKELDKVIQYLNYNPLIVIELGSHTDSRGADDYNLRLSEKRAKSAVDYLKKGLRNPSQVYGKGYGESRLINRCQNEIDCSEVEHSVNRRTEFRVVKNPENKAIIYTESELINNNSSTTNEVLKRDEIVFKVQIFVSSKEISKTSELFKNYKEVDFYVEDNMYKYTIGESSDYQQIKELHEKIKKDFQDSFIVKFKNGKRI